MPLVRRTDAENKHRIDLPADGEFVVVLKKLSRGMRIEYEKRIVSTSTVNAQGVKDIDAGAALEAAEYALLEMVILEWSFPEPVTLEAIRDLDDESMDAIKVALDELYKERTPEQRKNS